jgi:glutathione S-transferase
MMSHLNVFMLHRVVGGLAPGSLPHEEIVWCQVCPPPEATPSSAKHEECSIGREKLDQQVQSRPRAMKLYYAPGACSLSPHIVAREAGLTLGLSRVDTKQHRFDDGEDFYAINPRGYVPVLELDDGSRLREGAVIVQFLADSAPKAQLIPLPGSLARVRAQEWLNFIATEYHKQFIWLLRGAPDEIVQRQRIAIGKILAELDAHLAERSFIMDEKFSVVDAYAFTITRWCSLPTVSMDLTPFPHLTAYMMRIAQRARVVDALTAEGLI